MSFVMVFSTNTFLTMLADNIRSIFVMFSSKMSFKVTFGCKTFITLCAIHYALNRLFTILSTALYGIGFQTESTFQGEVGYNSIEMYKVSYFGGRLFGR